MREPAAYAATKARVRGAAATSCVALARGAANAHSLDRSSGCT